MLTFPNTEKDQPGVAPVLITKIRKGQELKIRCTAKKVRLEPSLLVQKTA